MICAIFNNSNTHCSLVELDEGSHLTATPFGSTSEMVAYLSENKIDLPVENCFAGWVNFRSWLREDAM